MSVVIQLKPFQCAGLVFTGAVYQMEDTAYEHIGVLRSDMKTIITEDGTTYPRSDVVWMATITTKNGRVVEAIQHDPIFEFLEIANINRPYKWIASTEADRFAIVAAATDINKVCLQLSDKSVWRLIGVQPSAWEPEHSHQISDVSGLQYQLDRITDITTADLDAAVAAAEAAQESALTYRDGAAAAAAFQRILPATPAALPYQVIAISGGVGTGSGGTAGTYAGGVSGGPAGFTWAYTIGADGKLASYAVTNPGISTSTGAPTLSLPSGGITDATAPTAVVSTIPAGALFSAPTADGMWLAAWGNNAGTLATAPFGGTQTKVLLPGSQLVSGMHRMLWGGGGISLIARDSTGRIIQRLAPATIRDLVAQSAFTESSPVSVIKKGLAAPGRYADGIMLWGLNRTGEFDAVKPSKRFATMLAEQVGGSLAPYNPVASGLIPSSDVLLLGDSMSTPTVQSAISSGLSGRAVYCLAHGGQDALSMAITFGASPLFVTLTGNQIPASGGVVVTDRTRNILNAGGTNMGSFRCSISGVAGLVTTDASGTWTFTRDTAGSAVTVSANVQAVLDSTNGTSFVPATGSYRGMTVVVRLGRNGLRSTRAERKGTTDAIRSVVSFLTPTCKRVIVISPYNGRAKDYSTGADNEPSGSTAYEQMLSLIEEMKREFPQQFVDMRTWAVKNAIYDLGLTPTADDLSDISQDCIPRQLFNTGDNTHVNTTMQSGEGAFIANILTGLGW